MQPIKKILVPTDFSECAEKALERALDLRQRFGAEITLLHSYELPLTYSDGLIYTPSFLNEIEKAAASALAKAKEAAERRAGDLAASVNPPTPQPTVSTTLVCSPPSIAIEDEARRGGYDLIVMGTHGRTGIRRALMGSVAERVVRTAPCAVMTVRQ